MKTQSTNIEIECFAEKIDLGFLSEFGYFCFPPILVRNHSQKNYSNKFFQKKKKN